MSLRRRVVGLMLTVMAVLGLALGLMYVAVACESLPPFLGAVPGDSHPRTPLGVSLLALAVILGLAAVATLRWARR